MIIKEIIKNSETEDEYKLGKLKKGIFISGYSNNKDMKEKNLFYGHLAIIADHCNHHYLSLKEFEQLVNFLGFYKK